MVTGGLRQGLSLLWGALAGGGLWRVAVEEPGWPGQRETVRGAGLEPVPVPVDADGLVVDALERTGAGAVVVTPANQFPTGAVLAPERRAALVEWARRHHAVIVEDDYDAQYRYDRDPVGSLQGLAPELTVHGGSASKILAPGMGIGWLVLPDRLVEAVAEHKARVEGGGPVVEQVAFAGLLESGELDRHLRRTRRLYGRRRERVLRALGRELPGLAIEGAAAGMHVVVRLPAEADEDAVLTAARRRGVRVFGMGANEPALLLGYGRLAEESAPEAVRALAAAVRETVARMP
jgi:GntR family transcriptional regulator / MocR family aminotransferase